MKDGGPAFPCIWPETVTHTHGMTLRQWFAGMALTGILSSPQDRFKQWQGKDIDENQIASAAYILADAMIEFEGKEKR